MPPPALHERPVPSQLREARRQLMNRGSLPADLIQPELARSWLRSWESGLQPCGRLPGAPHASGAQLARALELQQELVAHAWPVMEFVFEQIQGTDSMIVLAGSDGMLLHAAGDLQFVNRAERVALRPGATWHEQYRGTNAIGTALTDDCAVIVHARPAPPRPSTTRWAACSVRLTCRATTGAITAIPWGWCVRQHG